MSLNQFWTEILDFAENITKEVGDRLVLDFGKLTPERKSDGTLVTQADKWSDQVIREAIATKFPTHGVLTEETEHIFPQQDWCWVVDPIDGTTNFTRGIPIWGISLGLLYQGTPVFGLVHFPQIQQTFHGYWYGKTNLTGPVGAYLNHQPIHTSSDSPSQNHIFNLCARSTAILKKPFPCKIRLIGVASYNISLVACGAALGGVEATPKIWDIAAVWAILQGAGGCFTLLNPEFNFPLEVGKNYRQVNFPCLTTSNAELVPVFKPRVSSIYNY